jgi:hypothetical protein
LLGGGYNSTACIKSYYNVISGLLDKQDYFEEADIPDDNPEEVQHTVRTLKERLSDYWAL